MTFVRVPGNPEPDGAEELWLEGRDGTRLRALWAPAHGVPPRGSVILCNGRTEFIEKYFEVIRALQDRGFAIFTMDWRGQGLSDRQTHNQFKGHLDSLDDAVADLAGGLKTYAERLPRPHILVAHSMGGGISLRALQTRRVEVDGALFSAPMWGIGGLKKLGRDFAHFMTSLGLGKMFAPGQPHRWKKEAFKRNPTTHDRDRHARAQALVMAEPKLALAGVTLGWVDASVKAMDGFEQPSALAHLRIPITVLSAGEEQLVDNEAHDNIVKRFPSAKHVVIDGARHEIMMEREEQRGAFWREFDALAAQVAPRTA